MSTAIVINILIKYHPIICERYYLSTNKSYSGLAMLIISNENPTKTYNINISYHTPLTYSIAVAQSTYTIIFNR